MDSESFGLSKLTRSREKRPAVVADVERKLQKLLKVVAKDRGSTGPSGFENQPGLFASFIRKNPWQALACPFFWGLPFFWGPDITMMAGEVSATDSLGCLPQAIAFAVEAPEHGPLIIWWSAVSELATNLLIAAF